MAEKDFNLKEFLEDLKKSKENGWKRSLTSTYIADMLVYIRAMVRDFNDLKRETISENLEFDEKLIQDYANVEKYITFVSVLLIGLQSKLFQIEKKKLTSGTGTANNTFSDAGQGQASGVPDDTPPTNNIENTELNVEDFKNIFSFDPNYKKGMN